MAVELASAYVSLIPSFKGGSAAIERELGSGAEEAGRDAGKKAGKGFESSFSDKVKGIAAIGLGAGVGATFAAGMMDAVGQEAGSDMLAAQLGIQNPEYAADLGKIAGNLYKNNFGDSVAGVNDAIKAVLNEGLLSEDATNAQIEGITGKALTLAQVFQQDVGGTAAAAGQLIKTGLVKNADEAFDVITRGFQQGVDKRGDFLDTLNEYGTQFQKLGLDATTATGLLSEGLKGGARDADLVADALKEFSIRAVDGSSTTAEGFKAIGLNADYMTAAIAQGGPTAKDALGKTLDALRGIEDPAKRAQAAVALFGTQSEDLGAALFKLDSNKAPIFMGKVEGAAQKVADQIGGNASAKLETFKRKALQGLVDILGGKVLPAIEKLAGWVGKNLPLIEALGLGITAALVPAFIAWAAAAIPAAAATVIAAAPVIALGIAIGGLALLVIKNWDTIKAAFQTAADFIGRVIGGVIGFIRDHWPLLLAILTGPIGLAVLFITTHFDQIVDFVKGLPGRISAVAKGMWDGIKDAFKAAVNWIIKGWNKIEFKIPGFKVGPVHFGGFTLGLPDIPTLHTGGVVPGRVGTEVLARVQAGETVLPIGAGVGSGGLQIVHNINGNDLDMGTLAEVVTRKTSYRLRTLVSS